MQGESAHSGGAAPIAITGIGVVTPIGIGHDAYWTALRAGCSGIAPIQGFPLPARGPRLGAEVQGFTARDFISSPHGRRMDKLSRFITAASRMAIDDARVQWAPQTDRVGIVVGSAVGNLSETGTHLERLFGKGPGAVSPLIFPNLVMNAPASYAAMELGVTGVNLTVAQGEISGEQALVLGCDVVNSGRADVVIAGGGDELSSILFHICRRARSLSGQRGGREWCSPYDADRNGVILGEGAAMLVLESSAHAAARGATVYAEIDHTAMFSVRAPAYDWPAHALGAARWLAPLVADTQCSPLIVGAANASRQLDACELELFSALDTAAAPWLTSIKGAVGEFGAAGALSVATACLALRDGVVPPLCHLRRAAAAQRLSLPQRAEEVPIERALVCTIARGGAAAALGLRRPS